jgi:hypothetical protein
VAALRGAAGTHLRLPAGVVGLIRPEQPTSVYLAFPGSAIQVEVYDPSPTVARRVALSGDLVPVP